MYLPSPLNPLCGPELRVDNSHKIMFCITKHLPTFGPQRVQETDSDGTDIHELSLKTFLCSEEDNLHQAPEIFEEKRFVVLCSLVQGWHIWPIVHLQIIWTSDVNCDAAATFNSVLHFYYLHTMGSWGKIWFPHAAICPEGSPLPQRCGATKKDSVALQEWYLVIVISLPGGWSFYTMVSGVARHQYARPHPREGYNLYLGNITVEKRYEQHSYMLPR